MPTYSDLHRAVASGSTRRITMQLDTGIDINIASDPDKDTPLHIACRHGELASVQLLLDRGADTERTNSRGGTALFASLRQPAIARILIDRGVNHGAQDVDGNTPLFLAATGKYGGAGQAVMEMLLQHGANPDTAENSGCTPLHAVCHQDRWAYGRVDAMKMLIEHRVDVNAVGKKHKNTPLHDICTSIGVTGVTGLVPMARMLVENGANLRATDAYGATPLHNLVTPEKLCSTELLAAVQLLVDGGADVNAATSDQCTALHVTSFSNAHLDIAKLLVRHGADLDVRGMDGCTPLHIAASRQCCAFMSLILGAGARVNACDGPSGETPLFFAARLGRLLSVKVLLRFKADALLPAQFKDAAKMLPLDVAARRGHLAVVRELVQQVGLGGCGGPSGGADALAFAASKGRLDTIALLLDAGVVDSGDILRSAIHAGRIRCAELILQRRVCDMSAYVSQNNPLGKNKESVIFCCFLSPALRPSFCRVVRLLLDAGVETSLNLEVQKEDGQILQVNKFSQLAKLALRGEVFGGVAMEERLWGLRGLYQLLMQEQAVTAISWAWPAGEGGVGISGPKKKTKLRSALATMMPLLRRRAARRGMVLRALSRCVFPRLVEKTANL